MINASCDRIEFKIASDKNSRCFEKGHFNFYYCLLKGVNNLRFMNSDFIRHIDDLFFRSVKPVRLISSKQHFS